MPPKLERFPAPKQRRLDELLEKNSEGTITKREKARLESLVAEAETLMASNGRKLATFSQRESAGPPSGAIPVTVWVQPHAIER